MVKILVSGLLEGVKDLSTSSRISWWTNEDNRLPKYIDLYAIPATMPGAGVAIESLDQSALFNSASTSLDCGPTECFTIRVWRYWEMCQDGRVSCDRAVFWPSLLRRCGWDMENRRTESWRSLVATGVLLCHLHLTEHDRMFQGELS